MATSVEVPQTPPVPARLTVAVLSALVDAGAFPGDYQAELAHGEYVVSPRVKRRHSVIMRNVFVALYAHVEPRGLGEAFPDGTCFALPHRDDTLRCPDVSFVAAGRLPAEPAGNDWFTLAPDLVVEVRSPDERRAALTQKLDDYFAAGTALAWVVDPARFGVEVHLADRSVRVVLAGATLDGGPVLPDFRLAVDAIFTGVAPPR